MHPSQRQMCPNPALLKHPQVITDPLPNFTVSARHCGLWASPGLHRTIRWPGVGQSWNLDSSEKMTLLQSSTVQSLWSFANLSLALLCFSPMKGFFFKLCPVPRSLFWTILAVHFTPAAICHSFCRSLDVILWLLSDIWMSWQSSWSAESPFQPLPVCIPYQKVVYFKFILLSSSSSSSWALLSFRYMWGHTVERNVVPHRTTVLHKYRHTTL